MFRSLNIRGLIPQTVPSKVPYIENELIESSAIAFGLTETWLNKTHLQAETKIEGYELHRSDRQGRLAKKGRSSGGAAIYVRNDVDITTETLLTFSNGVIESICLHLKSLNLVIINTYRSPDNNPKSKDGTPKENHPRSTAKQLNHFLRELRKVLQSLPAPNPDVLMMGDYNLPHANWITGLCTSGASKDEQEMVSAIYNFCLEFFLVQQIECSTHRKGNTLDLLFTNNAHFVHNIEVIPSSATDHFIISFSAVYNSHTHAEKDEEPPENEEPQGFNALNFFHESIDWSSLTDKLESYDWHREFRGKDVGTMMDSFNSVCYDICAEHVPPRTTSPSPKIPNKRRSLIRRRAALKKRYITAKSQASKDSLFNKLVSIEKELQKWQANKRSDSEAKAVEKIKVNSKYFFAYAKRFSKVRVGIGPLINSQKELISKPQEMAEILSSQYSSVFSKPVSPNIQADILFPEPSADSPDSPDSPSMNNVSFSESDLKEAMDELSSNAAPGPDGFPAILLKKCSDALSPPLTRIWRKSLECGIIPSSCKTATISPIHKGKSRAVPKNYRPIALTSHLIKVFEKVIRKRIVEFMTEFVLFNKSQHGFRGGRSCLSQLLEHFDRITSLLEKGYGVDVIYLDFAKAFDKLDHYITLSKLKALGIKGSLGRWITNFLTGRVQNVIVDGHKSMLKPVISGVPQGSVLGPLLFLILMGDIDEKIRNAFLSSFADDTRAGNKIQCLADVTCLQEDLQVIYDWSDVNNMEFHCDKFDLLRYKSNLSREVQAQSHYTSYDGSVVEEKTHVKDLGITMSSDATFTEHISERCEMAKSKTAWILRTFQSRDSTPMLLLWKSLVLCHIEYCSQLWSPSTVGKTQSIELLQRSYVNCIDGMRGLSYWEQLKRLKLFSLERRRERYQVIYTWRILEKEVPNFDSTPIVASESKRRGRLCIPPPISSSATERIKSIRFATLPHKGPRLFNSLPASIRNITDCPLMNFKLALDKYLLTLPDEPLLPSLTQYRTCESNSIIDWAIHKSLKRRESYALGPLQDSWCQASTAC